MGRDSSAVTAAALEEINHNLFETLQDGMVVLDPAGQILNANSSFCRRLGYTRDEVIGIPLSAFQPADQADSFSIRLRQINTTEYAVFESANVRKDGWVLPVEISARAVDMSGNRYILCTLRDISRHKKIERRLKDAQESMNAVLEAIPDLLFEVGLDGRYYDFRARISDLLAAPADQLIGRLISDVLPPEAAAVCMEALQAANRDGHTSGQQIMLELDGEEKWFELSVARKQEMDTTGPHFIILSRDITGRKKADLENQENLQRLDEAQRIARTGSWELDLRSGKLSWSAETFSIFELDPAKFSASYEGFLSAIHPEDREQVNRAYSHSLAARTPYEITHRLLMPDGRVKWVQERCETIYDSDGDPLRSLGTIQDITRQTETELALAESRARFEKLVEYASVAISILHGERFLFVNPAMQALTGYSGEALLSMTVWEVVHPDFHHLIRERIAARQRGEPAPSRYEFKLVTKQGDVRLVDMTVNLVSYDGKPCSLGFLSDITERRIAEAALLEQESQYHLAIDTTPEGFWVVDMEGRLVEANEAYARMSGYSREELIGMRVSDLDAHDDPGMVAKRIGDIIAHGGHSSFESQHQRKDGSIWPVEVIVSHTELWGGRLFCFFSDLTEHKQAEEEMQLARMVYDNSSEAIMVSDGDNRIIAVNPAFVQMTGYTPTEVIGRTPSMFKSGRHDTAFYREMWRELGAHDHWHGEIWDMRKNGDIHAKLLTINIIRNAFGTVHRYVALFTDITERKRNEEMIWRQANYDLLTGLPNRRMFQDRLQQEEKKCLRSGLSMGLMLIDLDRFKEVNDTLGHDMGDLLLLETAARVSACVRGSDTVSRLGGDEFAIILPELADIESVEHVAQHIIARLAEPYRLGADEVYISASVGISLYPIDTDDLGDLLKNADQAMYAAKSAGRSRFSYFTPELQEAAQYRMRLVNDLRMALSAGQFRVHYQPIVDLASGEIYKAEALVRWQHPLRGTVSPADFIPLAEETGLIIAIGNWVFEEASRQAMKWRTAYHPAFQVSVNKSPVQLRQDQDESPIWPAHLTQHGIPGQAIAVEITEGMLLNSGEQVNNKLRQFREAGIQISVDDFGTGYSSLAYLKRLDIDYLKIDQSFVRNLADSQDDYALCEAIIVMAHKLGLQVVAEGVETETQLRLLRDMGCDFAQGYLFSRPVSAEDFEALLNQAASHENARS